MADKRDTNSKGTLELYNADGARARVEAGSEAEASFRELGYSEPEAEAETEKPAGKGKGKGK